MLEYLTIGSTPAGEDCAQVGSPDYLPRMRAESTAFIHQLIRIFGKPPGSASFRVKGFPHDFGTYHEVVVAFDDNDEAAVRFAYHVENNTPESWDDAALKELHAAGFLPEGYRPKDLSGFGDWPKRPPPVEFPQTPSATWREASSWNKFTLEIELGTPKDIAWLNIPLALQETAARVRAGHVSGVIRDLKGNTIGHFEFRRVLEE